MQQKWGQTLGGQKCSIDFENVIFFVRGLEIGMHKD